MVYDETNMLRSIFSSSRIEPYVGDAVTEEGWTIRVSAG